MSADKPARSKSDKDYAAFSEEASQRLRFQIEFAQAAIRNLLLVNGGAVLALLTALGNSVMHPEPRGLWWSFFWFALGLSAALAAYFAAFYSQLYFYNSSLSEAWNAQQVAHELPETHNPLPDFQKGNRALVGGVVTAIISLSSFVIGAFVALGALVRS